MHLDVADQREVLAERMTDEAVVGQDPAQVRMPIEQDAEQVERFALEPIGGCPHVDDGVDDRRLAFARVAAQTQAPVMRDRQQLIDDGEPRRARGSVDDLAACVSTPRLKPVAVELEVLHSSRP